MGRSKTSRPPARLISDEPARPAVEERDQNSTTQKSPRTMAYGFEAPLEAHRSRTETEPLQLHCCTCKSNAGAALNSPRLELGRRILSESARKCQAEKFAPPARLTASARANSRLAAGSRAG